jgi:hypothetical protein
MNTKHNFLIISLFLISSFFSDFIVFGQHDIIKTFQDDTLKTNQLLYVGQEWQNLFTMVKGDPFLFSSAYIPGSITVNGNTFTGIRINYDIYNDELLTISNKGVTLQLNKEMVDSFSLSDQLKTYRFINLRNNDLTGIGYVNVLYNVSSILYIKYKKDIQSMAADGNYDLFFRTSRIYLINDGVIYHLTGKKDLLKAFPENKDQVRDFLKKNKTRISKSNPESFIPAIRYYDSLRK